MKLSYKAVTKDGKVISGLIEAKDVIEAGTYLRGRGILPIRIVSSNFGGIEQIFPFLNKTSNGQLVFFTRQLSSMLVSGLTLMQGLNVLKQQIQDQTMGEVIQGIITDMEDGRSFSQAIEKYPETFTPIYVSLIKAGETSGLLEKVMLRLADTLEKQQALKSTIKSALMYPIIIVIGMILVMVIMMIFVIPQLSIVYTSLHVELPITTQIVIGISNFTVNYWPIGLVLALLIPFLYSRVYKTQTGHYLIDSIYLRLPVFGKLIKESILSDFTRTFGLMVGSGTLVVDALNQSGTVVDNILYRRAIEGVSKRVEKGIGIGDAMRAYTLFTPMIVQMVKIGEQTGKLDESLIRVSDFYEREVSQSTKTLTTALEPFILVFLGAGVGFLVISIITPIYSIINAIK